MSDLIRREDVVKAMNEALAVGDISRTIANDILNNIPSADPEWKWIPVTEALPEEDEEVLVTVRFDGTKDVKSSTYVETASQIGGSWTSYSDEWKVSRNRHHIIAWMPLPEPWRGE